MQRQLRHRSRCASGHSLARLGENKRRPGEWWNDLRRILTAPSTETSIFERERSLVRVIRDATICYQFDRVVFGSIANSIGAWPCR